MSFSRQVKEELASQLSNARHCGIAELATIWNQNGKIISRNCDDKCKILYTENILVAKKFFTLLKKTFNIGTDISEEEAENGTKVLGYSILLRNKEDVIPFLQAIKKMNAQTEYLNDEDIVPEILLKSACCKRAFLRGSFLTVGSMSDPEKSYHLEFVCTSTNQANQIKQILKDFEIEAKIIQRKKHEIVYIKESASIVELLNVMEAHVSLMNLENLRIVKEMRNSINRRVNCEAANITKTVNASAKQIDDIKRIRDSYGFQKLPENLRSIAIVRLEYPEATLKELGEYLDPPVGKSGVNHRLRRLSEIVEDMDKISKSV